MGSTNDELIKQVNGELIDLGNKLKKELWTDEDKKVLQQRAVDLVGLNVKIINETDDKKKAQYKLAAQMILQHVQSMALLKMLIAEQATMEAIKNLLWELLTKIVIKYLPALI